MNQLKMFLFDLIGIGVVAFHLFIASLPTIILLMTIVLIGFQIRYYYKALKNIQSNNNTDASKIE